MSKKLFQDMLKIKKTFTKTAKPSDFSIQKEKVLEEFRSIRSKPNYNFSEDQDNSKPRLTLWFVAVISIVFLFFAISFVLSSAKVTIEPKVKILALNQNYSATKDSSSDTDLSFDLIVLGGDDSRMVQTGEEKDYVEKAKGMVIVYNMELSSQPFSVNTRLEGSNGKIYKTDAKIVVPGRGDDGTPGSIEVGIYGSEAGAEYNSTPIDFKILGFKGTPKYSKFYARSKSDIIGGLKGKSRQVSDLDKANVVKELNNSLKSKLFDKAFNQIPSGYVLFKDASFVKIDNEDVGLAGTDGLAQVSVRGTFYGFILNEKKITEKIVQGLVADYDGSEVYIPNIKELKFSLNNTESMSFVDATDISFNLSGMPEIVWKFEPENLVLDLLGKNKRDFNKILSQYPNIGTADLVIKPVWKTTFPDKSKDIEIIVKSIK